MLFLIKPTNLYSDSEICFPDISCINCAVKNSHTISEKCVIVCFCVLD